jgi:hypothetical protein
MKSLESILKHKTSSSQVIVAGVSSARIVYLANLAISEILGQNKSEAKAVYIKNQILMIECKSSVIAQELRMEEKKILAKILQTISNTTNIRVRYSASS